MLHRPLGVLCLAALAIGPARADSTDLTDSSSASAPSHWSVRGFGTAALTWTDSGQAEYSRTNRGTGVGQTPRADVDSNFGMQASYAANADWSGTVQALVRKGARDEVRGELTWAYLKGRVAPGVNVRVGRIGAPLYMISDYRNVGYANTAIRPPQEVYSLAPIDSVDGADLTWKAALGDYAISTQLFAGHTAFGFNNLGTLAHTQVERMLGMIVQAERGPLSVRIGHTGARLSIHDFTPINELVGGLRGAGEAFAMPHLSELGTALEVQNVRTRFSSLGVTWDSDRLMLQSEYARLRAGGYVSSNSAWYLLGGVRFGKLLPYVSWGQLEVDGVVANTVPPACPPGYPDECGGALAMLSAGVMQATPTQEQATFSVGMRWDLGTYGGSAMALKFQVDRIKAHSSSGLFLHAPPGFAGPVTVGALALDVVF